MSARISSIFFIVLSSASLIAQNNLNAGDTTSQSGCTAAECKSQDQVASAGSLPSTPSKGKWEVQDFRTTDASISCSVAKYDSTRSRPILHLICPQREVFAPLRVHLTLSWKDVAQIPLSMRTMLVETDRVVRFKSTRIGESSAELTLQAPNASRSVKEWIKFTDVNVGLVLPDK
jgi:hypothetical protein